MYLTGQSFDGGDNAAFHCLSSRQRSMVVWLDMNSFFHDDHALVPVSPICLIETIKFTRVAKMPLEDHRQVKCGQQTEYDDQVVVIYLFSISDLVAIPWC